MPRKSFTPKKYWCPTLSCLRDKKRMWWTIFMQSGRPHSGIMYDCYKVAIKMFRKICRQNMTNVLYQQNNRLNLLFTEHNVTTFWKALRSRKRNFVSYTLCSQDFGIHFSNIMNDNTCLSEDQLKIHKEVSDIHKKPEQTYIESKVTVGDVQNMIHSLKTGCSPGIDGVTSEHLTHGISATLLQTLSLLYSAIMSWGLVADVFTMDIIIPILKKSTLNPNIAANYRPITLSSVHSKMIELCMIPDCNISNTQLGFR